MIFFCILFNVLIYYNITAIKPTNSDLRDKIDADGYNSILNVINSKYAEIDKFIENLQSDITAVIDFEKDVIAHQ